MGRIIRNMVSSGGNLNDRFISELLSRSCGGNEEGTEMGFVVHLCCESLDVEVRVKKGDRHYSDTDGDYLYTEYKVVGFVIRDQEDL